MNVGLYESTVSMLNGFEDSDLLIIKEFLKRLSNKIEAKKEIYNPYKPLTREEIIEQLAIAKKHADDGMVMNAHQASASIREKYGL